MKPRPCNLRSPRFRRKWRKRSSWRGPKTRILCESVSRHAKDSAKRAQPVELAAAADGESDLSDLLEEEVDYPINRL